MKYVIIRCEDAAWNGAGDARSLLDGAKLSYLQELAQAGAVGLMAIGNGTLRGRRPPQVARGFAGHWTWLGYAPADLSATPTRSCSWEAGRCYATSKHVTANARQVTWCCEFVTQHGGRMVDPTAGRLSTKEATPLIDALNEELGTPGLQWVVGEGSHHILIVDEPAWLASVAMTDLEPPDHLVGHPWHEGIPGNPVGKWIHGLLDQAIPLLERHDVNRVRIDLGEDPANLMWLWGPSTGREVASFHTKHGLSGAIISRAFPFQGLARLLGLAWIEGANGLHESAMRRVSQEVLHALAHHDLVYLPLRIDQTDQVERQCIMERIDQQVVKPLVERLLHKEAFRCLVAVEDRFTNTSPFIAIGSELPSHPVVRLTSETVSNTQLKFQDGATLFQWFVGTR